MQEKVGMTSLMRHADRGEIGPLRELLETSCEDIDEKDQAFGRTALAWSCVSGQVDVARLLVQSRAYTRERTKLGLTALLCGASEGHPEIVQFLLASKSSVHERDRLYGRTALILSAHRGHTQTVRALLVASAAVNDVDHAYGMTALMWSALGGRANVVALLVKASSCITARDYKGRCALDFAKQDTAASVQCLEGRAEVERQLLTHLPLARSVPSSPVLSPSPPSDYPKVAYISDVEGHWEYFCKFVALKHHGLRFSRHGINHHQAKTSDDLELYLEDGWHFVFGGDSCDKGPGTLRFLEAMVRLKKKYPERVHLILGNRDINKIRWTAELAESEMGRFREIPAPYWIPEKARVTFWQYLRTKAAKSDGVQPEEVSEARIDELATIKNYMLYLQDMTMGAAGEFEFRRQELAFLRDLDVSEISDDEVLRSYAESLAPGGWMRQYLELGQLGAIIGESLFVHGQIIGTNFTPGQVKAAKDDGTAWCVGWVPGEEEWIEGIHDWLSRLNAWARSQIQEWEEQTEWVTVPSDSTYEGWSKRGGAALIAYGCPGTLWPTVVYTRWLTEKSMPLKYPPGLVEHLENQSISFVVVGHTPHGNSPTAIPNEPVVGTGVTIIMGDTSFSHMNANLSYKGDNRGIAVHAITLHADKCQVRGHTEAGQIVDYEIGAHDGDENIGSMQEGDESLKTWFVKAVLPISPGRKEKAYIMCHVNNFIYDYCVLSETNAKEVLKTTGVETPSRRVISSSGDVFGHSFLGDDNTNLLQQLFEILDANGDGVLTKSELLAACTNKMLREALMHGFPDMDIEQILEELNSEGDISAEHFHAALKSRKVLARSLKQTGIFFEAIEENQTKRKPFPHSIGPFRLHDTCNLLPSDLRFDEAPWIANWRTHGMQCEFHRDALQRTASLQAVLDRLPMMTQDGEPLMSYLSPIHEVTVTEHHRETIGIPVDAHFFSFCHPFFSDVIAPSEYLEDPDVVFLTNGGYVYFDADCKVLALKGVVPSADGGLRFGPPRQLKLSLVEALRQAGRWYPVTFKFMMEAGAMEFCWIRPNERIANDHMHVIGNNDEFVSRSGGFAYLGRRLRQGSLSID